MQKTLVQRGDPREYRNGTVELSNNACKKSPKEELGRNLNSNISAQRVGYSKLALKALVVLINTPITKMYQEPPPIHDGIAEMSVQ